MLEKEINNFTQDKTLFSQGLQLSSTEIAQLLDTIRQPENYKDFTPEATQVVGFNPFFQLRRTTSQLYCLNLLKQNNDQAYTNFVEPQAKQNTETLSKENYAKLCSQITSLDSLQLKAVRIATIISGGTLCQRAQQVAKENGVNFNGDSVEFLADVVADLLPEKREIAVKIYPVLKELYQDLSASQIELCDSYLKAMFPHRTHFRHMLFVEGANEMFENLRHANLTEAQLRTWFVYWLTNIAGFQGQINTNGSVYLNNEIAIAILGLWSQLQLLSSNSDKDILQDYLNFRAQNLFPKATADELKSLLPLAAFACKIDFFTEEQGKLLQRTYEKLPAEVKQKLVKGYILEQNLGAQLTPTYSPALLKNGLTHLKKSMSAELALMETICKFELIRYKALQIYKQSLEKGTIKATQPLSFKELSQVESIELLADPDSSALVELKLNESGGLYLDKVEAKALSMPALELHRQQSAELAPTSSSLPPHAGPKQQADKDNESDGTLLTMTKQTF